MDSIIQIKLLKKELSVLAQLVSKEKARLDALDYSTLRQLAEIVIRKAA